MVNSDVEICNIALGMLGEGLISDLGEEGDPNSIKCDLLYQPLMDLVLRSHDWLFATYRQVLAASAEDNLTAFDYMYQRPTSPVCLRPICLIETVEYTELPRNDYPFYPEGQYLYSNIPDAGLKFIGRISSETEMDSSFAMYFAAVLAQNLAIPVTGDRQLASDMRIKAYEIRDMARWDNAEELFPDTHEEYWV